MSMQSHEEQIELIQEAKSTDSEILDKIAVIMHYPSCWDTMNFPCITDAINEMYECQECKNKPTGE